MKNLNIERNEFISKSCCGIDYVIPDVTYRFSENYYHNITTARNLMWSVCDAAFGGNSDTIEVVDDNEKNWLINFLISNGNFKKSDIHETPNMAHVDLIAYSEKNDTFYTFECKERNCNSDTYRNSNGNFALVDDEKFSYINESLSKLPKHWKVIPLYVNFYRDGNVYFHRTTDFNPVNDRTITTERTHKKKQGSRRKVQLKAHMYDLDHPRLMVHDEQVKQFYN